ncbi:MAG: hypothetical protein J6R31_03075 [Rikenellaceae bacterium]|nr:hypothetical protein [Rikenellaceae bacterium]
MRKLLAILVTAATVGIVVMAALNRRQGLWVRGAEPTEVEVCADTTEAQPEAADSTQQIIVADSLGADTTRTL